MSIQDNCRNKCSDEGNHHGNPDAGNAQACPGKNIGQRDSSEYMIDNRDQKARTCPAVSIDLTQETLACDVTSDLPFVVIMNGRKTKQRSETLPGVSSTG